MNVHIPHLHMPEFTQKQFDRFVLGVLILAFFGIMALAVLGMIYGDPEAMSPSLWGPSYPPMI